MKQYTGVIITIIAAISWGFSGTCGQYIFDTFDADPTYLTAARLLSAGVLLVCLGFVKTRPAMTEIWKSKESVIRLLIFSIAGIMFCQLTYMKAISYTNSGTATILQYTGPVLVMVVSCFMAHRLPQKKEVFAIIMALCGTFIIATHGDIHTMVITPKGLGWGLWSAFALMLYTLLPVKLTEKFGTITTTGYGMLLGGIVLCSACRIWEAPVIHDSRCLFAFIAIVIFGTVLPFTLFMTGVSLCGPVKASMLASIEPVSATVFMVIWLKVPFYLMDFVGFLCIFITVFLLVKKEDNLSGTPESNEPVIESPRQE